MNEPWNVMEDLQCLFTNEAPAKARAGMRNLILDTTDTQGLTGQLKADVKKKKRIRTKVSPDKTSYSKQKREMIDLVHQVAQLENQLAEKRCKYPVRRGISPWEKLAREQFYAKAKALQENTKLKLDVSEQSAFIEQIVQFLRRKAPTTIS
ncbi:unnamed protein product [Aphanomyces euteiches]|uniref:Uncharacterized protein n=1 Tax=Aphanomyces euteiches TaxID=100861 RepID=A0A6G0X7N5_9STRA|nr:hypothetical protein Ae201684_007706 [Aphanomyces euteiches]KAH9138797.1 hypothetical protein AeRB84_016910 [Aphanomyces euteiches]